MSQTLETQLTALLQGVCPRVFPDFAPVETPRPYVTYQHIGGTPLRYVDGSASGKRWAVLQINTWADTKAECLNVARGIEDAICTATAFTGSAEGEVFAEVEPDFERYGARQDFQILATR